MKRIEEMEDFIRKHKEVQDYAEFSSYCWKYNKNWYKTFVTYPYYFSMIIDAIEQGKQLDNYDRSEYIAQDIMEDETYRGWSEIRLIKKIIKTKEELFGIKS